MIEIWGRSNAYNVQKVLWALHELGLQFQHHDVGSKPGDLDTPEFLSMNPSSQAKETLADAAHIFEALAVRLTRRESAYGAVFAALLQIAGVKTDQAAVAELLEAPDDDPDDLEALDKVWEESEVVFGPDPNAGCPQVRDMLARMDEPTQSPPNLAAE